jgi:hypothetical protein
MNDLTLRADQVHELGMYHDVQLGTSLAPQPLPIWPGLPLSGGTTRRGPVAMDWMIVVACGAIGASFLIL